MEDGKNRDAFDFMLNRSEKPHREHHDLEVDHSHGDLDSFIFGKSRGAANPDNNHEGNGESILGQLDWGELFYHIDTLIESSREFKPLFSKVMPYLENFLDKKKS